MTDKQMDKWVEKHVDSQEYDCIVDMVMDEMVENVDTEWDYAKQLLVDFGYPTWMTARIVEHARMKYRDNMIYPPMDEAI